MSISSIGASSLNWLQQAAKAISRSSASSEEVQSAGESTSSVTSPAKAIFANLDQDISGSLDATEFQLFVDNINAQTGQSLDSDTLMTSYDQDGDGTLSGAEMDVLLEENRPEPESVALNSLNELFDALDEDGDATLTSSEFEALVAMINEATGGELDSESLLDAYDEDGDGSLNEAEALAALEANQPQGPPPPPVAATDSEESSDEESTLLTQAEQLMATYDSDGDGTLSKEELLTVLSDALSSQETGTDAQMEQNGHLVQRYEAISARVNEMSQSTVLQSTSGSESISIEV